MPQTLQWSSQHDFAQLLSRSSTEGKPVLLDLHSPDCPGCRSLDETIYSNPVIAQEISEHTLPVRISTKNPDRASTDIINNHIFIWSPTIQLLAPDATRYHEWSGAPRRTRLSVGYKSVFHDTPGHMTADSFRAQLMVARGKAALRTKKIDEATRLFSSAMAAYPGEWAAVVEAERWLDVAKADGRMADSFDHRSFICLSPLARAVERFAQVVAQLPDSALMRDWIGKPGPGDWQWYSDCLREVVLQAYQELCDFGVEAGRQRALHGPEQTTAHRLLAQHRLAYREFQSLFVGVPESLLDQFPLPWERSIRENLAHVVLAEWWAYRPQILHALDRGRRGLDLEVMSATDTVAEFGEPIGTHETLSEMLAHYERLHTQNSRDYSKITDAELSFRSAWWENGPVDLRFRLMRYIWHPRDHAVSIETILDALGHKRTSTQRFAARLFSGLGVAEGPLIGASDLLSDKYRELTRTILERTVEAEKLLRAVRAEAGSQGA